MVRREHGDAIEQEVFWHSVDLFKLDVDLIFYDATAWFECDEEDVASHGWRGLTFAPLRKRGHSMEGRDPVGCGVPTAPHRRRAFASSRPPGSGSGRCSTGRRGGSWPTSSSASSR
jgi:hypothetical protein